MAQKTETLDLNEIWKEAVKKGTEAILTLPEKDLTNNKATIRVTLPIWQELILTLKKIVFPNFSLIIKEKENKINWKEKIKEINKKSPNLSFLRFWLEAVVGMMDIKLKQGEG